MSRNYNASTVPAHFEKLDWPIEKPLSNINGYKHYVKISHIGPIVKQELQQQRRKIKVSSETKFVIDL